MRESGSAKHSGLIWTILIFITLTAIVLLLWNPVRHLLQRSILKDIDSKAQIVKSVDFGGSHLQWEVGDIVFCGELYRAKDGVFGIRMEQPEEICGMRLEYDTVQKNAAAEFMGMSVELHADQISAVSEIGEVWSDLMRNQNIERNHNGVLTEMIGSIDQSAYRLMVDADGKPKQLSFPNTGNSYEFVWEE